MAGAQDRTEALARLVAGQHVCRHLVLEADTASILGHGRVAGIALKDGRQIEGRSVVFAIGIRPETTLARDAGIPCNRGILVDDGLSTEAPGVYAVGDIVPGLQLAHRGYQQGIFVAEEIAGLSPVAVAEHTIPRITYSHPEVASVGATEEKLKEQGRAYKVGKFSFMGNGRAKAVMQAEGFVKILADKATDRILGCHIIGPSAGEMIHEICVAMEFGAAAEDVARTCHAHPTFSEAVREAALACGDGPIHA